MTRSRPTLAVLCLLLIGLVGCADEEEEGQPTQELLAKSGVFFGAVGLRIDRIAIAVDGNGVEGALDRCHLLQGGGVGHRTPVRTVASGWDI
jgi:hypothetical protein